MVNRFNWWKAAILVWVFSAASSVYAAADQWGMNMPKGVTPISKDVYYLHMTAIAVCAFIGIIVFGVMIYSMIYHRKSKGHVPATFHDNTRLEIVWSIIPFLILVALAIPATRVLMRMEDNRDSDLTIKVVGSQWHWQYQYLDQGISFFSNLSTPYDQIQNRKPKGEWYLLEVDKPLVLPIRKKIRFIVTAVDVVHSWWVPSLGIKRDAIPGFMRESWAWIEKPGIYRGQCAELCGINHGYMPIVVKAVDEAEFNQWVSAQPKVADQYAASQASKTAPVVMTRDLLMKKGRKKYRQMCLACHKANGKGLPPMYPALKGSSVAVGYPISRHISLILDGIAGSAMQPYRDMLTDEDIAAIVTYERNAWGNNTNDIVQPDAVSAVRHSGVKSPVMIMKTQPTGKP